MIPLDWSNTPVTYTFKDLIDEAYWMLKNRGPEQAELIVHIAKLTDEDRAAIVLANQILQDEIRAKNGLD